MTLTMFEVIQSLQNNPESWKIYFQNEDSIVFAWSSYRFTRLSDRFNCVMILSAKNNMVSHSWTEDDPTACFLYAGLIEHHL